MTAIDQPSATAQFLAACPSFAPRLKQFREDWEEGSPSLFLELEELGRHVAELLRDGRTAEIVPTLQMVELALASGLKRCDMPPRSVFFTCCNMNQSALVSIQTFLSGISDQAPGSGGMTLRRIGRRAKTGNAES
jgi:hypothetical protein